MFLLYVGVCCVMRSYRAGVCSAKYRTNAVKVNGINLTEMVMQVDIFSSVLQFFFFTEITDW